MSAASPALHGYPRPQLERAGWISLDGPWQFAFDPDAVWHAPADVVWDREIVVPFAPETPASRIGDDRFYRGCWYRRSVVPPPLAAGQHLLLHFCAPPKAIVCS